MKQSTYRFFSIIGAMALIASVATTGFTQESDDAMNDFMNAPADEAPPVVDDLSADTSAKDDPTPKKTGKAAAKAGGKAGVSSPGADPAAPRDVVDMRLKGAAEAPVVTPMQPNPALDKIEALMIAEAEMKVFMKSGGLRSRKIK